MSNMANVAALKKELNNLINQQRSTRSNKNTSKSNSLLEQIKQKHKEIDNAKQLQKAVGEIAKKNGEKMKEKESSLISMTPNGLSYANAAQARQNGIIAEKQKANEAAINAAKVSPTSQRQFLFHVIYDKDAANDKYTAEDISKNNSKLMEVYRIIDKPIDSKKHFIIHVAYDVDAKKYTPADKSADAKSAGDIFTQINPNNVRSTVTNRPIANLTEETKRDAEQQHTNLASAFSGNTPTPLSVQRSEDVESFIVGEPTKASKASKASTASISTVMPIPNSPKAELLSAVSDASSTNTQRTLKEKLEAARKKLQNAKTAQLNKSGNTKAKANAVNNASHEVKLAENNLAAFNRSKQKSEFNSNGGTRRRKQKKSKTQRKRQ